ncbi:MAG: prephenate dehydratase [Thermodesulfobacteriota bacterium]
MKNGDLLSNLRKKIDGLDRSILELLLRRAELVGQIGGIKRESGLPIWDPERELKLLAALAAESRWPLPAEAIERIFAAIIDACRQLQGPARVAFLGPEATFCHTAAQKHFGAASSYLPQNSIRQVFREVESERADFGVAPVENSSEGMVGQTLDLLLKSNVKISGEVYLRVSHALLSREKDLKNVRTVLSHPQALGQCLEWLAQNLPSGGLVAMSSTAAAAGRAAEEPESAAIGHEKLAQIHGLNVLARDIQDRSSNLTRFLVLSLKDHPATGRDKTSLWFAAPHKPGSLYRCLKPLAEASINLTRIESRPAENQVWEYVFFLDLEGHAQDGTVRSALAALAEQAVNMVVLGSYPRADATGNNGPRAVS